LMLPWLNGVQLDVPEVIEEVISGFDRPLMS
jgi:hypothetical protein